MPPVDEALGEHGEPDVSLLGDPAQQVERGRAAVRPYRCIRMPCAWPMRVLVEMALSRFSRVVPARTAGPTRGPRRPPRCRRRPHPPRPGRRCTGPACRPCVREQPDAQRRLDPGGRGDCRPARPAPPVDEIGPDLARARRHRIDRRTLAEIVLGGAARRAPARRRGRRCAGSRAFPRAVMPPDSHGPPRTPSSTSIRRPASGGLDAADRRVSAIVAAAERPALLTCRGPVRLRAEPRLPSARSAPGRAPRHHHGVQPECRDRPRCRAARRAVAGCAGRQPAGHGGTAGDRARRSLLTVDHSPHGRRAGSDAVGRFLRPMSRPKHPNGGFGTPLGRGFDAA